MRLGKNLALSLLKIRLKLLHLVSKTKYEAYAQTHTSTSHRKPRNTKFA